MLLKVYEKGQPVPFEDDAQLKVLALVLQYASCVRQYKHQPWRAELEPAMNWSAGSGKLQSPLFFKHVFRQLLHPLQCVFGFGTPTDEVQSRMVIAWSSSGNQRVIMR